LVETCLLSCSKSLWSLGTFSLSPLFSKTTQFDIVIVVLWGVQATARGEEGMTLFFVCCNPNCGHRWRD
jgi:hypothetical protein